MQQLFHLSIKKLDELFSFHSTSGKNASFSDSVHGQPFFINTSAPLDDAFPYIHAGGSICYTAPVTYTMAPFPLYLLLYVTGGEGTFYINETAFTMTSGSLLFFAPGKSLSFTSLKTPFTYQLYFLSGNTLSAFLKQLAGTDTDERFFANRISNDFILNCMHQIDRIQELSTQDNSVFTGKFVVDILTELIHLTCISTEGNADLPKHVALMKQIFDHDYKKNHSLDDLEADLGISKYRLCHDFSKYMEISPLQYLNSVRIQKAKELLSDSNITIHEVGSLVGIPNTNHFIRLFQKDTGVTPLKYRQSLDHFSL